MLLCRLVVVLSVSIASAREADLSRTLDTPKALADSAAAIMDACRDTSLPGGIAGAFVFNGQVVYKGANGWANFEHRVPFTPTTKFDFASLAKQFTGMAVAMLALEGKLGLDDDIRTYLPELHEYKHTVTIRHLLHHTGGIREGLGLMGIAGRRHEDVIDPELMWRFAVSQSELNFVPGDQYTYSNTGYFLLATIVSRVTEQPFPEWAKENIFDPLGMNDTQILSRTGVVLDDLASSYVHVGEGQYFNQGFNLASNGSSSLISTLDDMVKWILNFESGVVGGPEVFELMQQPAFLNSGDTYDYGFGLHIRRYHNALAYEHGGGWAGFHCEMAVFPESGFAFIYMCSRGHFDCGVPGKWRELGCGQDCEREVPENPQVSVSASPTIELTPNQLSRYSGVFHQKRNNMDFFRSFYVNPDSGLVYFRFGRSVLLRPVGKHLFRADQLDDELEFTFDDSGQPLSVLYRSQSWENKYKWYGPYQPPVDNLGDYCGRYWSEEIEAIVEISLVDGGLVGGNLQKGYFDIHRETGDYFWCTDEYIDRMVFERGDDGQVTGMIVDGDGGRVANLHFIKADGLQVKSKP